MPTKPEGQLVQGLSSRFLLFSHHNYQVSLKQVKACLGSWVGPTIPSSQIFKTVIIAGLSQWTTEDVWYSLDWSGSKFHSRREELISTCLRLSVYNMVESPVTDNYPMEHLVGKNWGWLHYGPPYTMDTKSNQLRPWSVDSLDGGFSPSQFGPVGRSGK